MNEINYKMKYMDLKAKFMSSVDAAYRLGYEQGMQEGQMQAAAEAQAMQAEQQAAAQGQGNPEASGQDQEQEEAPQEENINENPSGSELDKHIEELESMLGKSEKLEGEELKKAQNAIASFKQEVLVKRNNAAIHSIAKSLNKKPAQKKAAPMGLVFSPTATKNLNQSGKDAVSMQHKIVDEMMKSWEKEEQAAAKDIANVLKVESLLKKE